MKIRTLLTLIAISTALFSCSTPYQRSGFGGGYEDSRINEDMFLVSFKATRSTSESTVYRYFLRRCAEIASQNGYDYFSILDNRNGGNKAHIMMNNGFIVPVKENKMIGTIRLFKEGNQPSNSFKAEKFLPR